MKNLVAPVLAIAAIVGLGWWAFSGVDELDEPATVKVEKVTPDAAQSEPRKPVRKPAGQTAEIFLTPEQRMARPPGVPVEQRMAEFEMDGPQLIAEADSLEAAGRYQEAYELLLPFERASDLGTQQKIMKLRKKAMAQKKEERSAVAGG